MKLARAFSDVEARKVQTFVLLGGVFTTLAIWTKLEDPINLPKMFVLVLFGAIVLGLALPSIISAITLAHNYQRIALTLVGFFIFGLLVSTVATDVRYTAIFGEYHRNNGFLSYLGMSIFMVAGSLAFSLKSTKRYFAFLATTGLFLSFYGILQGLGADPVGWKIEYNPFITTLGNPNFTSGFLGLSGIAILFMALDTKNQKHKVGYVVGLLADLYILIRSGSIQGVFGFLIGAFVLILVKLWLLNKRFGKVGLITAAFVGTPVALAVFNMGPLASKLYQGTLRNRFDYWNAAIDMFNDHKLLGVGIDRFGEFYRQYAVQNQVVQGQITDNAHSIYLQLLATGGLSLFVPYILLVLFITLMGFKTLIQTQGADKIKVSAIFGIWLATIIVNIVTIDNLGVGIWFWITAGVMISASSNAAESINNGKERKDRATKIKLSKLPDSEKSFPITYFASFIFAISVLIILVPALGKSSTLYNFKNSKTAYTAESYIPSLVSESKSASNDVQYLIQLAHLALTQNAVNEAFDMIDQINEVDTRSYYGNYFAAFALEALNKRSEAIKYRERLKELDPWNNASLIELIKDYLSVGDRAAAAEIAALIKRNYPGSQSEIDASALLVG